MAEKYQMAEYVDHVKKEPANKAHGDIKDDLHWLMEEPHRIMLVIKFMAVAIAICAMVHFRWSKWIIYPSLAIGVVIMLPDLKKEYGK